MEACRGIDITMEYWCLNCTRMNGDHCRVCIQDMFKNLGINLNDIRYGEQPREFRQRQPRNYNPR